MPQEKFYTLLEQRYEIDTLVHLALEAELERSASEYTDGNDLIDEAVRGLLKSVIDGSTVTLPEKIETVPLSVSLEPDTEHMIEAYIDRAGTSIDSVEGFLEAALRQNLGFNDLETSVDLSTGLLSLVETIVEEDESHKSTPQYIEQVLEESIRSELDTQP